MGSGRGWLKAMHAGGGINTAPTLNVPQLMLHRNGKKI